MLDCFPPPSVLPSPIYYTPRKVRGGEGECTVCSRFGVVHLGFAPSWMAAGRASTGGRPRKRSQESTEKGGEGGSRSLVAVSSSSSILFFSLGPPPPTQVSVPESLCMCGIAGKRQKDSWDGPSLLCGPEGVNYSTFPIPFPIFVVAPPNSLESCCIPFPTSPSIPQSKRGKRKSHKNKRSKFAKKMGDASSSNILAYFTPVIGSDKLFSRFFIKM